MHSPRRDGRRYGISSMPRSFASRHRRRQANRDLLHLNNQDELLRELLAGAKDPDCQPS